MAETEPSKAARNAAAAARADDDQRGPALGSGPRELLRGIAADGEALEVSLAGILSAVAANPAGVLVASGA